jgi:hypothetical protein
MRARLLGVAILLGFGALRLPFELSLEKQQRALHYHGAKLDMSVRQQLTQMSFVAALSGFRSIVASVLALEAHTAWQRTDWGAVKVIYDTICAMTPRNIQAWDMGGWHMAYNASVSAREDSRTERLALRLRAEREYFKLGEDFYLRGIQNNPDRSMLYERLATIYRDKFKDPLKASEYFGLAAQQPDAMQYVHRFTVYELAKVPGREQEAYQRLRALYDKGEEEHLPTLLRLLGELEEKLNIPRDERRIREPSQHP